MGASLYERIGGEPTLMAAVDLFYSKVLADEQLRPFFERLDMVAQTRKQIAFMAWALGGPAKYKGRDLRSAHAGLVKKDGLSDSHFDAVAHHLKTSLSELGVPEELIGEALAIVESTRAQVLGRVQHAG
jgi:hemoglobin